ncbi:MAG TPA: PTS system mannose/fructose/sorbose family transporter subunit IID [Gemmatimonadaceae bacterium]|nr:PTS system mannose/fructose/sorbose family transporter subunit IID [Gemmatimonadaceae bacterium]
MSTASQDLVLPMRTRVAMFMRLLAVQGSWNYESLLGTGIGFCTEPALRGMSGGVDGTAYREALARESRYFNAHPYLAAIAVGALARAELEGSPPLQIERFRTALCGPLGSVGDRLVWAGWLPLSSLLALMAFGFGAGPLATVLLFLLVYNVGHLGLRAWGLRIGWRHGMRVAVALGNPLLRRGPQYVSRAVALLAGIAVPLAVKRVYSLFIPGASRGHDVLLLETLLGAAIGAAVLVRLHGRLEGWRFALVVLAVLTIYAVLAR